MRATRWIAVACLLWGCGPSFSFDNPCDPNRTDRSFDPCECNACGDGYRCEAKASGGQPYTCVCDAPGVVQDDTTNHLGLAPARCCLPQCTDRECGDDGCGGWCLGGQRQQARPPKLCDGCGNVCVDHRCVFDPCTDDDGLKVCGERNVCGGTPACAECVAPATCDAGTSRCKAP